MAGRFITISVHKNQIEDARKYFSSVFFSNIILVLFINCIAIGVLYKLEYIVKIPEELVGDVKLLFGCIFLNFFISLIFNVYSVSTFIRNRLDLSSTRSIVAHALKALLLIALFYFFDPPSLSRNCFRQASGISFPNSTPSCARDSTCSSQTFS